MDLPQVDLVALQVFQGGFQVAWAPRLYMPTISPVFPKGRWGRPLMGPEYEQD